LRPHEVATGQQRDAQQDAEDDAHAGTEQALVDRILDQEDDRQSDTGATEPNETARAQPLLEPARRRLDRGT
jgi:hypothetical protein